MENMMITSEIKRIINDFINYGVETRRHISDMRESFNERLKDVSTKTKIDKKLLRKAVKLAYESEKEKEDVLKKEEESIEFLKILMEK